MIHLTDGQSGPITSIQSGSLETYVDTIMAGHRYTYDVESAAPLTMDDIHVGMVFRKQLVSDKIKRPNAADRRFIYHVRSYCKTLIYLSENSISYNTLFADYEMAIDSRIISPGSVLEWGPCCVKKVTTIQSPTYEELVNPDPAPPVLMPDPMDEPED